MLNKNMLLSRREMLQKSGMGLGSLALASLMGPSAPAAGISNREVSLRPLASRQPHFPAKAKHIIHLFMNGGPSHVDTFDPKPMLDKYNGKEIPNKLPTERKTGAAMASPFKFQKYGQSGIEVSDLFPHVAKHVDDMTVIRSMNADVPNHEPSLLLMNCGEARLPRPSLGSWLTYGLGSENENLPGYMVLCPGGMPVVDRQNWQSGFLPGIFQGTYIDSNIQNQKLDQLIENIRNTHSSSERQRKQLDLLGQLNAQHQATRPHDLLLEARIQNFELAYRMQSAAAEAFDVAQETQQTLEMYGPGNHGRQCLIARRLVERGVRMVQCWYAGGNPWDSHGDIMEHKNLAGTCDQAIGALLADLKQRGLLDETLVIWGGEFGRTPTAEGGKGRDHNHYGFSMWLAGGGVKGGYVHGATDEFGFKAVENKMHVHDLHATILHLMGFDHEKFTYSYAGRDFRLTDVHGRVVQEIIA